MRDLTDTPADDVATERERVAHVGWGARLLAARDADGQWMGGACFPGRGAPPEDDSQPWTATLPVMLELYDLGLDPASETAREMTSLVAANCRWEYDGEPFFDGEVEPCINGHTVTLGAYFGADVDGIVARLLADQLEDGGWNCEAERGATVSSFDSTICVLEGLLEYERAGAARPRRSPPAAAGSSTCSSAPCSGAGAPARWRSRRWLEFSFPTRWHYDVLRGLDYFRRADSGTPGSVRRSSSCVPSVRTTAPGCSRTPTPARSTSSSRRATVSPSRWNTLRARRVLDWWEARGDAAEPGDIEPR